MPGGRRGRRRRRGRGGRGRGGRGRGRGRGRRFCSQYKDDDDDNEERCLEEEEGEEEEGGEGEGEGEEEEGGGSIHKTRMMMMIAKRAAGQAAHCEDSGIREAVNRRMQRQRKVRYSCLRSVRAAKGQYGYGNIKVLRMRRGVGDWMRLRARAGSPSVDNLEYENSFRRWEMQRKDDEWMRKRREVRDD